MNKYEETVKKLSKLIEQYPDIENSTFHHEEDWQKTSVMYQFPIAFALQWGDEWYLKVKKMTINPAKVKNLEWISKVFPNLISLNLSGSSKIKSLAGLSNLANLQVLCLEKLSNWNNIHDLKNISNLKSLRIEVHSKKIEINLNDLPEGITELYFGQNKHEDLLYNDELDFTRFKNLTKLTIIASQLGDGKSFKLPSTLKQFAIYKNNSFINTSMFSALSEDCKIVIRSLHLSKMKMPKEFQNIKVIPTD